MTTRNFFVSLAAALAVLVAFNVFLALRLDSVSKKVMREMRAMPKLDVLFVGNSLMQDSADLNAFRAAWPPDQPPPSTFVAALSMTTPIEHYFLVRDAYLHHQHIRCLVYGFYDRALTDQPVLNWTKLIGNKAMDCAPEYVDLAAAFYAPGSQLEKLRLDLISKIPMVRDRGQLWKFVEMLRRKFEDLGMTDPGYYKFPLMQTDLLLNASEDDVRKSAPFIPAVEAMLKLARQDNTRVFIVEMPMITQKREIVGDTSAWQKYRLYLQKRCQAENVTYIDATTWVPDDTDYMDNLHPSAQGAALFSARLARTISSALNSPR